MDANIKVPMKKVKMEDGSIEEIIDWTKIDTPLAYEGKRIVLPGDPGEMPIDQAIDTLQRIKKSEDQIYDVTEHIAGLPWDAVVATYKAMQQIYGIVLPATQFGWFRDFNPSYLTIKTGHRSNDLIQVPVGKMYLPGMKPAIQFGIYGEGAYIIGKVNKKDRARLVEIALLARRIIDTDSIYKGKAIKLLVDEQGGLNLNEQPEFLNLDNVQRTDMIHTDVTNAIIETSILAPIEHTAECRRHKISLKRGILLEGKYGTGKTLTARVTAKVAMENGWTFVVLSRVQGLLTALDVAKRFQPSVLFAEDIDRAANNRSTKEATNDLINAMDSVVPANAELMVVLTTNYVDKIDRALLRPGRLDAVISIDAPDAKAVTKLIRHYGGSNLAVDISLDRTGELLAGQIPATVAEVVKRAKLIMLTYGRDVMEESDLVTAAESMKRHLSLLDETPKPAKVGDLLASNLRQIVGESGGFEDLKTQMKNLREYVEENMN